MKTNFTIYFFIFSMSFITVLWALEFTKIMKGESPFVTKFNGLYFMATIHEIDNKNKIAAYTSSDLKSWKFENWAIDSTNFPVWGSENNLWGPKIYQFGDNYNLYYYTFKKNTTQNAIGVATAATPNGPYVDVGKPLWEEPGVGLYYPNIAHGKFNFQNVHERIFIFKAQRCSSVASWHKLVSQRAHPRKVLE